MCEVRLSPASGCGSVATTRSSPVRENGATGEAAFSCDSRALPRYRVLRGASRGALRSVDRECAGRNAKFSVKEVEPRQSARSVANQREVVAERVSASPGNRLSEGNTSRKAGTAGVQDHSMYTRQVAVRLRSAAPLAVSPRPKPATDEEGLRPDFAVMTSAEVRCPHSSFEAGQRRWSQGGHGRVNQHDSAEVISEVGSVVAPYDERRWIHKAAERRTRCTHDGSSACGVDSERRRHARCSAWNHQPKSRMREICTSGSERGLDRSTGRSRST